MAEAGGQLVSLMRGFGREGLMLGLFPVAPRWRCWAQCSLHEALRDAMRKRANLESTSFLSAWQPRPSRQPGLTVQLQLEQDVQFDLCDKPSAGRAENKK